MEAYDIKKSYGDRLLFSLPELKIFSGDRIGIVGANGAGKSTLMHILSGELPPDEGYRKLYCETSSIRQFSEELAEGSPKLLSEFSLGGKTERDSLSGGEQTRVKITNALSRDSGLLFADEPTSNLDREGIELLYQKLSRIESLVLISHDRDLLDKLCNRILEIQDGEIPQYKGNYSAYREQRQQQNAFKIFEYEQYTAEKARLENAAAGTKARARSIRKAPKRMGNAEARLHRRSSTEIQEKLNASAKAIQSRLDQLEVKERPRDLPKVKLDYSLTDPPRNRTVINGVNLSFAYGANVLFHQTNFTVEGNAKTALIGNNGAGKTTLLNLICRLAASDDLPAADRGNNAAQFPGVVQSGSITTVPKARLGYFHQGFENLDPRKSVLDHVLAESVQSHNTARMVLAGLLFRGDDVYKSVSLLSGGEKVKLSLAMLLTSGANVLLLDEPTNFLDIESIEAVQSLLSDYEGTVCFVSHDRAFVDGIADRLLIVENKSLFAFEGNLSAYEAHTAARILAEAAPDTPARLALEMRLSKIAADMSLPAADMPSLEKEYAETLAQLRQTE